MKENPNFNQFGSNPTLGQIQDEDFGDWRVTRSRVANMSGRDPDSASVEFIGGKAVGKTMIKKDVEPNQG